MRGLRATAATAVLGCAALLAGEARAGSIDYQPVECVVAGTFPRFEARYEPPEQATSVRLFFRPGTSGGWYYVAMARGAAASFTGLLPKPKSSLERFSYYIEVIDASYGAARTPERQAAVVSDAAKCEGRIAGTAGSVATIAVGRLGTTAGTPIVPAGFSSANVVAQGAAESGAGTATAAGGAATPAAGATAAVAAGGAAAATGGGVSLTTVGLVGAAVAGGAVVATQIHKSDAGGGDLYTGPFSGDLTMDFGGCTRLERHAGTLQLRLQNAGGDLAGSTAEIEGTETVVSSQCSGGPQAGAGTASSMASTPVTGTAGSVAFATSETVRASDSPGATVTVDWKFSGSAGADTVTGVLTKTKTFQAPGVGGGSGTMRVPVTLQRQP